MRTASSSSRPGGVSTRHPPPGADPPEQEPPRPQEQAPPGTRRPSCWQNSWHTFVKILPCPKLRLRTVKILGLKSFPIGGGGQRLNSDWIQKCQLENYGNGKPVMPVFRRKSEVWMTDSLPLFGTIVCQDPGAPPSLHHPPPVLGHFQTFQLGPCCTRTPPKCSNLYIMKHVRLASGRFASYWNAFWFISLDTRTRGAS